MIKYTDKKELRTLTIEELKQFNSLTNLSDKQALEVISKLKEIALITHNIISNYGQPTSIPKLRKAE